MEAIVLDGEQRSALAVTRSLGRRGIKVTVGAEVRPSLSSTSRYCKDSFIYPSPYDDPIGFVQTLKEVMKRSCNSILYPMTDVTMTETLLNCDNLPTGVLLPFSGYDKYNRITDKISLFRLARELDVPIPKTFISNEYENTETLLEAVVESGFPVVVKPGFSKIKTETGWVNAKVRYAADGGKLREIISDEIFNRFPFLIQERIEGPGIGIFLLMKNGEVLAEFAHRRIREKPPSGGVSVLCESIELPKDAMEAAVKILAKVRWTGVAMVEFKADRKDNIAKLMEVNARFWGSLQLSISSGVDFPYLLFQMACGDQITNSQGYVVGLKSRWELGDLDHLLIRLTNNREKSNLPSNYPNTINLLKEFLFDFVRPSVRNEVLQLNDAKPFLHELKGYIRYCLQ
jgi:predicted ATP-grasp superfamily ATP-dependent carboligase